MPRLMTKDEITTFKAHVKRNWEKTNLSYLQTALEANQRLKQQIEIRNEVLQELINDRTEQFKHYPR